MGTITKLNGRYRAQIRITRDKKVVFSRARTFDREPAAKAWIKKREEELAKPGALDPMPPSLTLAGAIDRYVLESRKAMGKTKAQVLGALKAFKIGGLDFEKVKSQDVVSLAIELGRERKPQTMMNYLSHLSAVFAVGRSAWGVPLDRNVMRDAMEACKRMGLVAKSAHRDRRPSREALDRLYAHFVDRSKRRNALPMHHVMAFTVFSTRRQEEITRIMSDDLEADRVLVGDMKTPGEKIGNNVWCQLPREATRIFQMMAQVKPEIFPYATDARSAAFTRACKFLGIDNLHFHDLRHEGASRLFEMGWSIPQVAPVTGHRSLQSLQR